MFFFHRIYAFATLHFVYFAQICAFSMPSTSAAKPAKRRQPGEGKAAEQKKLVAKAKKAFKDREDKTLETLMLILQSRRQCTETGLWSVLEGVCRSSPRTLPSSDCFLPVATKTRACRTPN